MWSNVKLILCNAESLEYFNKTTPRPDKRLLLIVKHWMGLGHEIKAHDTMREEIVVTFIIVEIVEVQVMY
jgi:hypothetical protein